MREYFLGVDLDLISKLDFFFFFFFFLGGGGVSLGSGIGISNILGYLCDIFCCVCVCGGGGV